MSKFYWPFSAAKHIFIMLYKFVSTVLLLFQGFHLNLHCIPICFSSSSDIVRGIISVAGDSVVKAVSVETLYLISSCLQCFLAF